jgi:hypothetical protein
METDFTFIIESEDKQHLGMQVDSVIVLARSLIKISFDLPPIVNVTVYWLTKFVIAGGRP